MTGIRSFRSTRMDRQLLSSKESSLKGQPSDRGKNPCLLFWTRAWPSDKTGTSGGPRASTLERARTGTRRAVRLLVIFGALVQLFITPADETHLAAASLVSAKIHAFVSRCFGPLAAGFVALGYFFQDRANGGLHEKYFPGDRHAGLCRVKLDFSSL
jgi:hypothetical protein